MLHVAVAAKPTCKPGCSRHAAGTALYGLGLTPADCSDDDISCEACDVTSPDDDDNVISTPLNGGGESKVITEMRNSAKKLWTRAQLSRG